MADNKKISDLPNDTAVSLSDYVPIITPNGAQTKKASLASIINLVGSNGGSGGGGTGLSAVFLEDFVVDLPNNQTGVPNATAVVAGSSISTFLINAFRKASPAVYIQPNVSLSGMSAPAVVEVGTTIPITFSISFNTYDAGAEIARVLYKNSSVLNSVSGVYSDNIIASTTPVNYQAAVNYAQGSVKNNTLGSPDPSGQIPAGTVNSNVLSYQGFYKIWYDAVDTVPFNNATTRVLANSIFTAAGNSFTLNTGTSKLKFVVLLPPGKTLVSVFDAQANLTITTDYSGNQSTVAITDAAGVTVNYTMYTKTQFTPYEVNHQHIITIA